MTTEDFAKLGYRYFGKTERSFNDFGTHNPTLYQKTITSDLGKRFINVWQYNLPKDIMAWQKNRGGQFELHESFEVESVFETKDGYSANVSFYNLDSEQILSLSEIEDRISGTFVVCGGVLT